MATAMITAAATVTANHTWQCTATNTARRRTANHTKPCTPANTARRCMSKNTARRRTPDPALPPPTTAHYWLTPAAAPLSAMMTRTGLLSMASSSAPTTRVSAGHYLQHSTSQAIEEGEASAIPFSPASPSLARIPAVRCDHSRLSMRPLAAGCIAAARNPFHPRLAGPSRRPRSCRARCGFWIAPPSQPRCPAHPLSPTRARLLHA
eukprot:scaffold18901_cov121-Isochrysis_galbana.AAC.6